MYAYSCITYAYPCTFMHIYALYSQKSTRGPGPSQGPGAGPCFVNIVHKYAYMCMHMHNLCMNNLLWYLLWYFGTEIRLNLINIHYF